MKQKLLISLALIVAIGLAIPRVWGECESPSSPATPIDSLAEAGQAEAGIASHADTSATLSFLVVGDLMQHKRQFETARRPDGVYDYTECFAQVRDEISRADVAIGNLETTFGGMPYTDYPQFSSPESYASYIQQAGFDILLTANNHSVDTRAKGLRRTIEVLDTLGLDHLGTYVNAEARRQQYPFLLEAKGFRIALLNFTYATNGIRVPEPFIVNDIDTAQIAADIERARQMEVDAIIAFPHWGNEYQQRPSKPQTDLAEWMLSRGVTHVVGSHPHVIQPIEVRTDEATGQRHLVAYSLGNYVSYMVKPTTSGGITLRFTLARDKAGHCVLKDADYFLIWVDRPEMSGRRQFEVWPVACADSLLRPAEKTKRDAFAANARAILNAYNKGISEAL